jgi:tripartite-type tricarboxylate transporter receptor subunit TctC
VLHDAFKEALYDPAHVAVLERFDMNVVYMDSAQYAAFARDLFEQEAAIIRKLGLRMD